MLQSESVSPSGVLLAVLADETLRMSPTESKSDVPSGVSLAKLGGKTLLVPQWESVLPSDV